MRVNLRALHFGSAFCRDRFNSLLGLLKSVGLMLLLVVLLLLLLLLLVLLLLRLCQRSQLCEYCLLLLMVLDSFLGYIAGSSSTVGSTDCGVTIGDIVNCVSIRLEGGGCTQ